MRNPLIWIRGAEAQYKALTTYIVSPVPAITQDPEPRSLPSLTEAIEFLERIERSHPFIQRIAIRLYSWAKGIDQLHLYQIASIHFKLAGGRSW